MFADSAVVSLRLRWVGLLQGEEARGVGAAWGRAPAVSEEAPACAGMSPPFWGGQGSGFVGSPGVVEVLRFVGLREKEACIVHWFHCMFLPLSEGVLVLHWYCRVKCPWH